MLTLGWIAAWQEAARSRFTHDFLEQLRGDVDEESLAAKKGMLAMLLSIAGNLASCAPADDETQFSALEEAILGYQNLYPRMATAMQAYLATWLRVNNPGARIALTDEI